MKAALNVRTTSPDAATTVIHAIGNAFPTFNDVSQRLGESHLRVGQTLPLGLGLQARRQLDTLLAQGLIENISIVGESRL
jgi:hypothetical protein